MEGERAFLPEAIDRARTKFRGKNRNPFFSIYNVILIDNDILFGLRHIQFEIGKRAFAAEESALERGLQKECGT